MEPTIHQAEHRDRRGRRLLALSGLVAVAFIGAGWLGLLGFLGTNAGFGTATDLSNTYLPDAAALELDLPDLSRLSKVYTADGVLLGTLTERNSQPVALEEIPELVINAILASEDTGFYEHEGIDFRAIARAAVEDLRGNARQGGSTITQQVVKQNFGSNEQTIERKITEAVIAAELEDRYSKDEILEFYLNSVFFGHNAYGVKAAAQEYFGKELDELTLAEAAALSTPIRNPGRYDLRRNPTIVERARDAVLDNMVVEGMITRREAEAAKRERVGTVPREVFPRLAPQVVIAATEELLNNPAYGLGDTFEDRKRAIFGCPAYDTGCEGGGGLTVTVTLDMGLQDDAQDILRRWFPVGDEVRPTGAIAMVDNRTGAIKVLAGGLEFGEDIEAGQRDYDLAGKGRQNVGSAFKPIGLTAALERGFSLNSYWDFTNPQILDYPGAPKPWTCANFGRSGEGVRTLESATVASVNAVFCQVSLATGPENIAAMANRLGVNRPLNPVPSIVLGTQAVSPLEMAQMYSTLANYGTRVDAYLIERITDATGNVVYAHEPQRTRVVDDALAAAVVNTLEKVVKSGTGQKANIERPQAGKTGTHQNFTDVWFVGFIPQYTTAVWVGHADKQIPMTDITINGEYYARASSGRIPAPIWKEFMTIVADGLPMEEFPPDPPGTSAYYLLPSTTVPDVSTLTDVEEIKSAIYKSGLRIQINDVNAVEPAGTVVLQTPPAGTRLVQGETVEVDISNGFPPTAALPNLIGLHWRDVEAAIEQLKLETHVSINWRFVPNPRPGQDLYVFATDPAPGAPVETFETVITLFLEPIGN